MLTKRIKFLGILVLIISLAITMTACDMGNGVVDEVEDEPEVVEFEDSNLEEAVRDKINKPEGNILLDDVLDIEELEAPGKDIESIEGIQHLSNLKVLDLGSQFDSDAGKFKSNQINDISKLSELTNLEWLDFSNNEISDISSLANLTNLERLGLLNNKVSDISTLVNLSNLETLWLHDNEVSDISTLKNLTNLRELSFGENEVSDISTLANLTNLEWLGFNNSEVSDISPLENLLKIRGLFFNDNEVSDIGPLENLTNLERFYFKNNEVSDISPLVENDGLGTGDVIDMTKNYLDLTPGSEDMNNIQELIDRGVDVEYEPQK